MFVWVASRNGTEPSQRRFSKIKVSLLTNIMLNGCQPKASRQEIETLYVAKVNVIALVPIMGLHCADLLPMFPALVASSIFQFHEACHSAAGIADNNL